MIREFREASRHLKGSAWPSGRWVFDVYFRLPATIRSWDTSLYLSGAHPVFGANANGFLSSMHKGTTTRRTGGVQTDRRDNEGSWTETGYRTRPEYVFFYKEDVYVSRLRQTYTSTSPIPVLRPKYTVFSGKW